MHPVATLSEVLSEFERMEADGHLAKSCFQDAVNLRDWDVLYPLLMETVTEHKKRKRHRH